MTTPDKAAVEAMSAALQNAELSDGEGGTYRLFDLLDFSGENKARMVVDQLAEVALSASQEPASAQGELADELERLLASWDSAFEDYGDGECGGDPAVDEAIAAFACGNRTALLTALRAAPSGEVVVYRYEYFGSTWSDGEQWQEEYTEYHPSEEYPSAFKEGRIRNIRPLYLGAAPDAGLVEALIEAVGLIQEITVDYRARQSDHFLGRTDAALLRFDALTQPPQSPDNEGEEE